MKIGLVCPYNMYKGGGVQECVRAMQHELRLRGHEALVITPQPREHSSPPDDDTIFVGGAATVSSFHTTAQVSITVSTDVVAQVLEDQQFDILHFHEPSAPLVSRQILSRSNSVNIGTFHAKLPDTVVTKTLERVITPYTRSILKDLHHLTAVSSAAADYVRGLTDQPVHIISNGIDLDKFKKPSNINPSKKPSIFYVGRLEKRKGLNYLLEAFSILQKSHPDVELIIAGDGPDKNKLTQQVATLGLRNVQFLGYIDEAEKVRRLHSSSLFCSPALYGESFGIVLLEAMACGLPVVAGDNPGYTSTMANRGSLSLVDPRDSQAFASRLALFLYDQPLRQLWQDWARDYIGQFSYKTVVDKYEALYKQALSKK